MKKIRIISAFLAVILLTGCGKVPRAEDAIASIGIVSIESLERIEAAEALVFELSPNQKQEVGNLSVLTEARTEYNRLHAAVQKANDAILSIGPVTLSSGSSIRAARLAYEALASDNLTDYAAENYPILENAENQYNYLCAMDAYDQALKNYEQGNYDRARQILKTLEGQYPDHTFEKTATELDSKCILGIAEDFCSQGEYTEAIQVVDDFIADHPDSPMLASAKEIGAESYMSMATQLYRLGALEEALSFLYRGLGAYESAMEIAGSSQLLKVIQVDLEAIRPGNGAILHKNGRIIGGYGSFTVKASDSMDALIKLERVDDPSEYVLFYVRAGEEATISVKNGNYYAKYVTGLHWFGEDDWFGSTASYNKADDIMEFTVHYEGNYVYYSVITITLYATLTGNLTTTPITANDF